MSNEIFDSRRVKLFQCLEYSIFSNNSPAWIFAALNSLQTWTIHCLIIILQLGLFTEMEELKSWNNIIQQFNTQSYTSPALSVWAAASYRSHGRERKDNYCVICRCPCQMTPLGLMSELNCANCNFKPMIVSANHFYS